jgi:hypothetical protein
MRRASGCDACESDRGEASASVAHLLICPCASCLSSASGLAGRVCPWSAPACSRAPTLSPLSGHVACPWSGRAGGLLSDFSCAPWICRAVPPSLVAGHGSGPSCGRVICRASSPAPPKVRATSCRVRGRARLLGCGRQRLRRVMWCLGFGRATGPWPAFASLGSHGGDWVGWRALSMVVPAQVLERAGGCDSDCWCRCAAAARCDPARASASTAFAR